MLAALALALQPAPPPAASPHREISIAYGTCEDWTRARYYSDGSARWSEEDGYARWRDERARRMEQWAWGYLTAFERYGGPHRNAQARADVRNAIWGQLDAYCAAHPRTNFGDAVSLAVERLRRRHSRRR